MGLGGKIYALGVLAAGSGLLAEAPALAQSVAPTREELTRPQPEPPAARSTLNIVGGVERAPCPLADPEFNDVRVTISNVDFNNLKGATPEEMRTTWADYAGTSQPVADICEIRDRAATLLRNKGYLAAVQVPTQRIENGQVRLELLYARVTTIRARGETGGAEAKLASYLSKLTEDEIFDRNRAERYLLLARDLPGYNVQLTLKPAGTGPGELVGEVSVIRTPYSLDFTIQNLAAEETGRWGGQLRAQAHGLTGLGDTTSISIYSTSDFKEQQILQVGHSFRPGGEGLLVNGQFTYAWTRPAIDGEDNLKARTLFATLGLAYPLVRTQAQNLWVGGGFDFINQKVNLTDIGPLTRDRLRVLWARADFDAIDLTSRRPRWRVGATAELRRGLDIFNASEGCDGVFLCGGETPTSRLDGDPTGTLIRFNANAEYALSSAIAVAVMPRGQIGFDPLLSFEEFTGGNYTVGRGYDPATITGDSGLGATVELRGPRLSPLKRTQLLVQPYVFGDRAWVWNKNVDDRHNRLTSAGAGVRAALANRLSLDAVVAVPLEKAGVENRRGDTRFLLTLTSRLLPWRS